MRRRRWRRAPGSLIWVDDAYGLISWKMNLEIGRNVDTTFGNLDFVAYAQSFGASGYRPAGRSSRR
jgi:acetolactate synthase-1/2/3 large subunit